MSPVNLSKCHCKPSTYICNMHYREIVKYKRDHFATFRFELSHLVSVPNGGKPLIQFNEYRGF